MGRSKVEIIATLTRCMLACHALEQVKVSVHFELDDAISNGTLVLTQLRVGQLLARCRRTVRPEVPFNRPGYAGA